jgi:hypothetical protein
MARTGRAALFKGDRTSTRMAATFREGMDQYHYALRSGTSLNAFASLRLEGWFKSFAIDFGNLTLFNQPA